MIFFFFFFFFFFLYDPLTNVNFFQGSQYSVWQLSDLRDCTKTVGLFLFAGAHSDLWKTAVGAVVGVLNAQIMKVW